MEPLYDVSKWVRCGRGHTYEFELTPAQMHDTLREGLPQDLGPYNIISVSSQHATNETPFRFAEKPIDAFPELTSQDLWFFFIRSLSVSPRLELTRIDDVSAVLSLNGLINLQYQHLWRGAMTTSMIGVVHKVARIDTNEVRVHDEYFRIFNHLKQSIKKKSLP